MAIIRYFGLPGCGKTTILTMLAMQAVSSGKYKNVYTNVESVHVHGVTYVPFDLFGFYDFRDCCILTDEGMVEFGDRAFKEFPKERLREFVMHRHKFVDIIIFSQEPDGIDKKIRSITDRMYYVKKGFVTGKWISSIYKIPYGLVWPTENSNGENLGKIVMGYMKPPLLSRIFCKRIYRPKYYPYFNSWEETVVLDPIPAQYQPYRDPNHSDPLIRPAMRKSIALMRCVKKYRWTYRRSCFSYSVRKKHKFLRKRATLIPAAAALR